MAVTLGVSAFYHDSAAALVADGQVVAAAQEERFTRKKHDADFPANAARFCLREGGITLARGFPDFAAAEAAGAVRTARDAAALASHIGCDGATLSDTLETTRLVAPYFAIKVTGALFHTQGGLDIDAQARVLRDDGTTLPNLLAAGGAARGVSGRTLSGYLSGNGLLSAVAGGFIAARTAARQLGSSA